MNVNTSLFPSYQNGCTRSPEYAWATIDNDTENFGHDLE
jgi:hypothetical protein